MSYNLIPCIEQMKSLIEGMPECDRDSYTQGCILGRGGYGTVCYMDPKQCIPPIHNLEPFALKYMNFSKHIDRGGGSEEIIRVETLLRELLDQEVAFLNELRDVKNVLNIFPIQNIQNETYIHTFNSQEYCIATQYINGIDLFDFIEQTYFGRSPLKYSDIMMKLDYIAQQLILTLKEIHDKKILHLDIKPENIILDDSTIPSTPVIIDLGLAIKDLTHNETQSSMRGGTPEYVPKAVKNTTRFNDIYALGRTLGQLYFTMQYSDKKRDWIDHGSTLDNRTIIKDIDYSTFILSFINEDNPQQTIQNFDALVEKIKKTPITSRPNPTQVFNPAGMVSTVKDQDIDDLVEQYNKLQLEAYVRIQHTKDYDFSKLISEIRSVKDKLKKKFNLKSEWYHTKQSLENYPNIKKLVHVDPRKIDKGRPTKVNNPKVNVNKTEYDYMRDLVNYNDRELPSRQITEKDQRKSLLRRKSTLMLPSRGGKRKSRRKKSQRKGKRSIKKIKRKRSRKRY